MGVKKTTNLTTNQEATKVGADGGNGETKMAFENVVEGLAIPTAEVKVIRANEKGNFLAQENVTMENIHEHLDITYVSSKCLTFTNTRYIVGKKTLRLLGKTPSETDINEANKYDSEVVARTILAGLLVHAIRCNPGKSKIIKHYDLSLGLPFVEIDQEKFQKNSERFIGTHELTYHYPNGEKIDVTLVIEFALTLPESAIAGYAVVYDRQGTLKEYSIKVEEDGNPVQETVTLEDMMLLLADIGAGTLDLAVLMGINFDFQNSYGEEIGTKRTIEQIRIAWNEEHPNDKINSLTKFTEIYSNDEDFNSAKLRLFSEPYLQDDAIKIARVIKNKMEELPSNTLIILCGGGSLLFKDSLTRLLEKYSDRIIFKKDAKFANAEGLLTFALHPAFEEIKKDFLVQVNV